MLGNQQFESTRYSSESFALRAILWGRKSHSA